MTTRDTTFYYKSVLTFASLSWRGQIAGHLRGYSPKTPSSFPSKEFLHRGTAVSATLTFKSRKHFKKLSALLLGPEVPHTVLFQGGLAAVGARSPHCRLLGAASLPARQPPGTTNIRVCNPYRREDDERPLYLPSPSPPQELTGVGRAPSRLFPPHPRQQAAMGPVGTVAVRDGGAALPGGFWAAVRVWLEKPQVANRRLCGAAIDAEGTVLLGEGEEGFPRLTAVPGGGREERAAELGRLWREVSGHLPPSLTARGRRGSELRAVLRTLLPRARPAGPPAPPAKELVVQGEPPALGTPAV